MTRFMNRVWEKVTMTPHSDHSGRWSIKKFSYTVKVATTYVTGFETHIGIVTWSVIFPRLSSAFFNPFLLFPFSTKHVRVKPRHGQFFKSNKSLRGTHYHIWRAYTLFQIPPPENYWKRKLLIPLGHWLYWFINDATRSMTANTWVKTWPMPHWVMKILLKWASQTRNINHLPSVHLNVRQIITRTLVLLKLIHMVCNGTLYIYI